MLGLAPVDFQGFPATLGQSTRHGCDMPRVSTTLDYVDLDGDYGTIEGVELTCDRCGHSEESLGTSDASIQRCAILLRENCPRRETNFYEVDDR